MNQSDRQHLNEALNKVALALRMKPVPGSKYALSLDELQMYFDLLAPYSLTAVRHALHRHVLDPERGRFFPKVADIVYQIEGGKPEPDWVLAIARRNSTPLGAMARLVIGSFDLEHSSDPHYLRRRAEEVIAQWPELKERALNGEYTDHELRVFAKYKIDPLGPVELGQPRPANPTLPQRAQAALEGPEFKRLMAPPDEYEDETGAERSREAARAARQQLSALIADIPDGGEDQRAYEALQQNL